MNEKSELQKAVSLLTEGDRYNLLLDDNLSEESIVNRLINVYEDLKTLKSSIDGGFQYADAPTPKPQTQAIIIKNYEDKLKSFNKLNFILKGTLPDIIANKIKEQESSPKM